MHSSFFPLYWDHRKSLCETTDKEELMMSQYPFRREEELKDVGCYPAFPMPYGEAGIPVRKFNTPITPKENFLRICRGEMPL